MARKLVFRSRYQRIVALGLVLVVLAGAACSAVTTFTASRQGAPALTASAPAAAPSGLRPAAPAPAGPAAPAVAKNAAAGAPAAADSRAAATSNSSSAAGGAATDQAIVADTSAQVLDRMVIRTAQLTVEVPDIEQALARARAIASSAGGYVSASNSHVERVDDQSRMVADLTLQVRSQSADSVISDLRAMGNVTSENTGSQDVTDEYVDLDSNLRNLQATESAILKLMDKATQVQDVLSLQRELTQVRGQIERIHGRKTYLERRTDMATITLSLRLPAASTPQPLGIAWNPLASALRGWQASLTVLRGVADVLIVALAFSWWLVPLAGLGVYVWVHRRRGPTTEVPTPAQPA